MENIVANEQTRQFLDLIGQDSKVEAREVIEDMLSQRMVAALDARKQSIASTMFDTETEAE